MPFTWEISCRIENRIIENNEKWLERYEQATTILKKGGDSARGMVILEEMEKILSQIEEDMARLRALVEEAPEVA